MCSEIIFAKNFKRPNNREDNSVFDDFYTEMIASTRSIISKFFFRRADGKNYLDVLNKIFDQIFQFIFFLKAISLNCEWSLDDYQKLNFR